MEAREAYDLWNAAIAEWIRATGRVDEPVLLAIDRERLGEIGEGASLCSADEAHDAFVAAVRAACVRNDSIRVEHLRGVDEDGVPKGCSFLAFLVLAANERGEEGDDRFYQSIGRLLWPERELRQVTRQDIGMPAGGSCEEPLWREWNTWLLQQGFVPTARQGQGPRNKFRMYPLSQSTLSLNERSYLARDVFAPAMRSGSLSQYLDPVDLQLWLRRRARAGTPRLWASVHDRIVGRDRAGGHRFPAAFREAFLADCYDVYESVVVNPDDPSPATHRARRRARPVLVAGLLRITHLDGSLHYLLRPRRPLSGVDISAGVVRIDGYEYPLSEGGDPRWLDPVGPPLRDFSPRAFVVEGVDGVVSLDLPERPFWTLAPDPVVPSDELLISDRRPDPDEYFILLVPEASAESRLVHTSLARFKELGLLDWSSRVEVGERWVEYRRCRVLLSPWQAVAPVGTDPDVYARLAPEASDRIRLEGGLRDPRRRGAFMESALPSVAVVTESEPVIVRICELASPDTVLHETPVKRGVPGELPVDLPAGEYVLFAYAVDGREERELDSRRLLVTSWRKLSFDRENESRPPEGSDAWSIGRLVGATSPGDET
ncbi:MAG: hypothetical protein ACF8R9_12555 [Phycisphaerales bacterium JB054]